MRVIWNFIKGIIISVWALAAIVTTICLISYNDYSVSEVGDYSIFVVDNDRLEPIFKKNDIVIIKKASENKYKEGMETFFYVDNPYDEIFVNYGKIDKIVEANHAEDSYYFGDDIVSYGKLIGPANGAIVYHKAGIVLSILESRWGFMFFVILPTLFALVYEIFSIVEEAKEEAREIRKEERLEELKLKKEESKNEE